MAKSLQEIKEDIITAFPKLRSDKGFKVTSREDPKYNCIAWAYNYDDRWMWPYNEQTILLDGITYWPTKEVMEATVSNFIEAFRLKGYEVCDSYQHEDGYQKIALYALPGTDQCTHASRELRSGYWTSKLGKGNDIQHGDPTTIENGMYGKACCFMKRVNK